MSTPKGTGKTRVTCTVSGPKDCIPASAGNKTKTKTTRERKDATKVVKGAGKLRQNDPAKETEKHTGERDVAKPKASAMSHGNTVPRVTRKDSQGRQNYSKGFKPGALDKANTKTQSLTSVNETPGTDKGCGNCDSGMSVAKRPSVVGTQNKEHGLLKGGWFYKLSRPVIAGLKRKVNEKFHRDIDDSVDDVTIPRPTRQGCTSSRQEQYTLSSTKGEVTNQTNTCHSSVAQCSSNGDVKAVESHGTRTSEVSGNGLQNDKVSAEIKPWRPGLNENIRDGIQSDCQTLFLVVDLPRKLSQKVLKPEKWARDVCSPEEPQESLNLKLERTAANQKMITNGCEDIDDKPLNDSKEEMGLILQDPPSNEKQLHDRQAAKNKRTRRQGTCIQTSVSRDNHAIDNQSPQLLQTETSETYPDKPSDLGEWTQEDSNASNSSFQKLSRDHTKTEVVSDTEDEDEEIEPKPDRPSPPILTVSSPRRKCSLGAKTMLPLYRGRLSVLQAEKDVLLEMNSTLRRENEALRRVTYILASRDSSCLDVEQTGNSTNGDARPSEVSLLPRLSHGRLPSLATLTRINLRFNREHHGCLHRAVLSGKEEDVEAFLSAGKDINAHDEYGKTPLHCAVGAQKLDIVHCLLSHRPDIDAHDDRDDTPLHTAVRTGNIDIVTALLRDGHADSNSTGNGGCTPLHTAAQLEHVNNVAICKLLLEHNAKLLSRDHKWMTPLAHASLHGSYDVMVCLFHHAKGQGIPKDDLLFEVDGLGSTLLHLAVESGSARVVELCLDEGAAPHSVKTQDGSTPVHLACSYGYMDILDILMKAVAFILDPPPDQDGMLPVHRAAQSNHHEVIAYLLKQDMDQIDAIDHLGRTPIMLAAENGCFESVRVLLDHGANADIRDSENKTVLHYAIGGVEILKEILKDVKANSLIRAKDRHGNTPLHYASRHGCVKDVSIILMKYKASAAIINGMGEIPLHIAARYGWLAVVKKLTEGRGKRTMNANDANERTPLHLAAREGHDELVEFFLKRGARIDRDVHGQTPLHYAALQGSKKSLELILENKPDCLNVTDKNQNTSLHMAAMGGHAEILKFLLSKPDQIVSVNERNQNTLDIAIEAKHEAVAMAIAENKRWKEVVRSTVHGTYTQIQLLVRHMPEVAKTFLDRCVVTEGDPDDEDYKVSYDLKFIQGMPDEKKKTKNIRESLIALHTMVKYERLECLTHPLCSVLMDIKWKKFGLVCAFLNQAVYIIYISLIMVIMKYIVSFTKNKIQSTNNATAIGEVREDPLIVKSFRDDSLIATVAVVLIIACVYNLAKECFQMFDEGWQYFFSINNWMEVTLYVMTFVTIVKPRTADMAELAVCVFLAWIVLLHYISKFNYVGLYIVMIRKTVTTVFKVLIILLIFLAAFAFSFHVITVQLSKHVPVAKIRFSELSTSLAATFFMILDNLKYDDIVLQYNMKDSVSSGIVLYALFIGYCFLMPIIFLNLLIGLAVGDIDSIRKTAAMERYTSQVEHLSQLERALPTFILSKVQITEYVEYPNRQKNLKDKIVNLLVMLLSPRQEQDKKLEDQTYMEERVQRHEATLKEITSMMKKHSVLLEEMRDLLQDRNKRSTIPGDKEESESVTTPDSSEFFV